MNRCLRRGALALSLYFALVLPAAAQVPEDINAPYQVEDLEVEVWVQRFETEGREAYDFRDEIVASIALEPGQRVADVGAGTGLFEPLLAAAVGPAGKVYAIDIVPEFVDLIAERAAERGLEQVEARLGGERSIEMPAGSVDVVFISDAYHHFVHYEDMLASIHRALVPGGKLVVVEFDRVEGESPDFVLEHIRAGKEQFTSEIESAGFRMTADVTMDGMEQTFVRHFERQ